MTLYRIDDYAGTPSATDITPSGGYEPDYPYALAVDALDPARVLLVADDGTDQHWFSSANSGTAWTDEGATSVLYRGVKAAGDIIVMFGADIKYSEDGGATAADKLGDWNDGLGTPGSIRGLWIAL